MHDLWKMSKWNNFWDEFDKLQKKLETKFSDSSIYKSEDDKAIVIEVSMAGFPESSITVDLDAQSQYITVAAKTEKKSKQEEIFVGWSDVDLDKIDTNYSDGLLTIYIPFKKKELARKVRIMGASETCRYVDVSDVPEDKLDETFTKAVENLKKD